MELRKYQLLLCGILVCGGVLLSCQASAEVRTVEADGFYQMGDGMAQNQAIAKERAKVEAVRSAGEQIAVYVESSTEVAKGELNKDDISLLSAAVLQIKKIEYKPLVIGESIKFQCHIVAVVDTDTIKEKLQEDFRNMKSSLQKYQEENERLRRENPNLAEVYNNMGNAYSKLGKRKIALNLLQKAIELKHDYVDAYYNIGCVYENIGEVQKALSYYKKQ